VAIAKSGKPVPTSLPADVVPPSCRKQQKTPSSESPAEKQPVSLPKPTSRPPAGVTKIPAIQPPSTVVAKAQVQTAVGSAKPTAPAAGVDPFGMKPAVFESAAANAEKDTADAGAANLPAGTSQSTSGAHPAGPSDSNVEPSPAVVNEGMFVVS